MLMGPLPDKVNHRKLAADKAELEGSIPLGHFERLGGLVQDDGAEIGVRLQFKRGKKHHVLVLGRCEGTVSLVCQKCLAEYREKINSKIRVLIVDSETELAALSKDEDGLICQDEAVRLVDVVEDELILALPMVPKHADGSCGIDAGTDTRTGISGKDHEESDQLAGDLETHKPFEGLADLLKKEKDDG